MKLRIYEAREKTGMTQEQLSELIDVSQRSVSGYECNIREPSIDTLMKICKVCNVSINYILGLEEENNGLTNEEEKLLSRFRQLDEDGKELVLAEALRQQQRIAASPTEAAAV